LDLVELLARELASHDTAVDEERRARLLAGARALPS
jgi:hypothetical protein